MEQGKTAVVQEYRRHRLVSPALSLFLFRIMPPPTPVDRSSTKDAAYAFCEGIRRLQTLCAQARDCFAKTRQPRTPSLPMHLRGAKGRHHPVQTLPSNVRQMVLELIGTVDWLASIVNWVVIGISRGQICASPPDVHHQTTNEVHRSIRDGPAIATQNEQELCGRIITRAKAEAQSVSLLWRQGIEDEVVHRAVQQSVFIVVMLWKSLAVLTVAARDVETDEADCEEIGRHYSSISTLIDPWRSTFGKFNKTTALSIQQSGPSLRRSVLFCSNDGDLAVLQFYEVTDQLEMELALQPSTPAKERLLAALQSTRSHRKEHRLASAVQVSFLASQSQGVSSPGFQGNSGLKAYIQDIAAHPVRVMAFSSNMFVALTQSPLQQPRMTVLALSLAAKTFNDDVYSCLGRMDMKGASDMTVHLEACLRGLQRLRETLVMFPDIGHVREACTNGAGYPLAL